MSARLPSWLTTDVIQAELARRELARRDFDLEAYLKRHQPGPEPAPEFYDEWLQALFPNPDHAPLAPHHHDLWRWLWAIRPGVKPRPYAACWPRGHAKSGSARRGVVALGARRARRYVLYVMNTQAQANLAVQSIAALMQRPSVARFYPALLEPQVSQRGTLVSWNRTRLVTASGFIVEGMGLDSARRGLNIDDQRPDMIILDDFDDKLDSLEVTQDKITLITESILPMGTPDLAVLLLQNLILPTGIMTRLAKMVGRVEGDVPAADFLTDVEFNGPLPAVEGLEVQTLRQENGALRYVITGGVATWQGMDLAACEAIINTEGLHAFKCERQNEVTGNPNALLGREVIARNRLAEAPEDLEAVVVAVDPPAGGGGCGIVVKGLKTVRGVKHTYRLEDASVEGVGPEIWGRCVAEAYLRWKADRIVVEVNQGGKMASGVIRSTQLYRRDGVIVGGGELTDRQKADSECVFDGRYVRVQEVRATRGKHTRAEPVANRDHQGLGHFVGVMDRLETLWCSWTPGDESPDPLDADVWAEYALVPELGEGGKRRGGGL